MVALPAVANVVKVDMSGTYNGLPWMNSFYVQYTGSAPSTADLTTLAGAVESAWATNIAPLCHSSVVLTQIKCTDLTSAFAAQNTAGYSAAGTRAGTSLPTSVACVASLKVNFRYRGGHPRMYMPAGVVADVSNGHLWASAFITSVDSALSAFLTAINAITIGGRTFKMVAVSYRENNAIRTTPVVLTINSVLTHGRVDTVRRRLGQQVP